jgi:hypothetical protein
MSDVRTNATAKMDGATKAVREQLLHAIEKTEGAKQ